jgi:mRNA-degrading endonuclease RelE of RelBE toxin-antitoxin system
VKHLLNAWSRRLGSVSDYGGSHQPNRDGAPLHDLTGAGTVYPDDVYEHPEWYALEDEQSNRESIKVIKEVHGNPDAMVTIYRAVPPGVTQIETGNWVTISLNYARGHAMNDEDSSHDWPVLAVQVRARDVLCPGDSLNEYGYWGPPVSARVAVRLGHGNDLAPDRGRSASLGDRGAPGRADGTVRPGRVRVAASSYEVEIKNSAKKDIKALPKPQRDQVVAAIEALGVDPRSVNAHPLHGKLDGYMGLDVTTGGRGRALRVAYSIEGSRVIIHGAGTHEGFYEKMKRRLGAFGDSPEEKKALEELADAIIRPVPGRTYEPILPTAEDLYGGYIYEQAGRLYLEGQPVKKLYRVVHPKEWEEAQRNGYLQSNTDFSPGYTRASAQPDERWRYQSADSLEIAPRGMTLEITYDPSDGWQASAEGYAATHSRIPLSRVRKL